MPVRLARAQEADPGAPHEGPRPARAGRARSSTTCPTARSMRPSGSSSDLLDAGVRCRGGRGAPLHHARRPEGRAHRGTDRRGVPAVRTVAAKAAGPPDRDRVEPVGPAHRGRALLGGPGRPAVLGPGATSPPCCCRASRPTPPWPSSTASSGDARRQVHRRLPPAGHLAIRWPPARPRVVLPHSRLNTVEVTGVGRGLRGGHSESDAVGWSVDHQDDRRLAGRPRPGPPRVRSVEPAA